MTSKTFVLLGVTCLVIVALVVRSLESDSPVDPTLADAPASAASTEVEAGSPPAGASNSETESALVQQAGEGPQPIIPEESAETIPPELWDVVPPSVLRAEIMVLSPAAQLEALQRLQRLEIPEEDFDSLRVTDDGKLYYINDATPHAHHHHHNHDGHSHGGDELAAASPGTESLAPQAADRVAAVPPPGNVAAAAVPVASPPVRNSRPGSTNVFYLDFNGHTITGTSWNNGPGEAETYVGKAYDTDGDPTTFSDEEQSDIIEIWERVAEDFSPFDINVTTEEPAVFNSTTGRALITASVDANGIDMPSPNAGGVAQLDVFGDADYHITGSPAFVYFDNFSGSEANIAEAVTHELGHNLGLTHDGLVGQEYYGGHGSGNTSWGPIMGTGYGRNVSQWTKGDYFNANNTQDDFAVMQAKVGLAADEAGDTTGTAAAASTNGDSISNTGIISSSADVDLYSFSTAAGSISLAVNTYRVSTGTHGGNADLQLELLDAGGSVVATNDPAGDTNASLSENVAAGTYFARITPKGDGTPLADPPSGYTAYGSAGQYTLTGTIIAAAPSITSATTASIGAGESFNYQIVGTNAPTSYQATGLPAGLSVDPATGVISGRATVVGEFVISLSATNALGTGNGTLTLTVTAAAPVITDQTAGRVLVVPGATLDLSVTTVGAVEPTYQWYRNGRAVAGATQSSYSKSGFVATDAGVYVVSVTNAEGTVRSGPVHVLYHPIESVVHAWGLDTSGQASPPAGLDDAIAVTAGETHALALKADGTVVAWGSNNDEERDVPADLTDVVAVAAGNDVSFALKSDGTVVSWGSPGFTRSSVPDGLDDVIAISSYGFHALALKADGTIESWGSNGSGQRNTPANIGTVIAISTGPSTSYALNDQGTLFAWGFGGNGETTPLPASALWTDVSGGGFHALGLKSDGTVEGWGFSTYANAPNGLTGVVSIAAGDEHSMALAASGDITTWGDNSNGERTVPGDVDNVFAIAGGTGFSLAIEETLQPEAPAITTQPVDQTVNAPAAASFSVTATGVPAPTYQWRKGGQNIDGATTATLTIDPTAIDDAGSYDVVVTNSSGSVNSDTATLTVQTAPSISGQPQSQTTTVGSPVTLTVTATGNPAPTYQWRKDGQNIDGATSTSLDLGNVALDDAGSYDVVVTNVVGQATSDAALLTVNAAPSIGTQPQSQTVVVGAEVTFSVVASGTPAPSFQWRNDGVDIDGATGNSYTIASATLADAATYDVVVTNSAGSETSSGAALTVNQAPAITTQPQSSTVEVGTNVTLSVAATGTPAPTFQWKKDGSPINGATNASLALGTVELADAGSYTVDVSNVVGTATSTAAVLTVQEGPAITTQPISKTVNLGTSVTFSVVATGTPAPTYQWRKDGQNIDGETGSSLDLGTVELADAGTYTVAVSNDVDTVVSDSANLVVVTVSGTHETSGYRAGQTVSVSNTITYVGPLTQLDWSVMPPDAIGGQDWSLAAIDGTAADVAPTLGSTELLKWTWTNLPASPFTFSYELSVPDATTGDQNITVVIESTSAAGALQAVATPDPLVVSAAATFHSADSNQDFRLNLSELLRVIELYNTRSGTTRTGAYRTDDSTVDGFAPDAAGDGVRTSTHSADTTGNGALNLSELLRVIELYNTRSGTTRTGAYRIEESTVDGFAPDA